MTRHSKLIHHFGRTSRWVQALAYFRDVQSSGLDIDAATCRAAVVALAKGRKHDMAFALFSEMRRTACKLDAHAFAVAITACEKKHSWQQALALLQEMPDHQLEPDVVAFNATMSACKQSGVPDRALQLLRSMPERSLRPNVISYNTTISAFEKRGEWASALQLLLDLQVALLQPSVVSFSAVISACEKGRSAGRALELLAEMKLRQIDPNAVTYSAAISACDKSHQAHRALELFAEMKFEDVEPSVVTYNAAIAACSRAGSPDKALDILAEMSGRGLTPSVITLSAAIVACQRLNNWVQALALLSTAHQQELQPDTIMWTTSISACEKAHQWRHALGLLRSMHGSREEGDALAYYATIRAVEACGAWVKAMDLLTTMLSLAVQPHVSAPAPHVRPYVHRFQAGSPIDCFKHTVLLCTLKHMMTSETPLTFLDAHAGEGVYDLDSAEAQNFKNFEDGIMCLAQAPRHTEQSTSEHGSHGKSHSSSTESCIRSNGGNVSLMEFLDIQYAANAALGSSGRLQFYLGSPIVAQQLLRTQDRALLFESSRAACTKLQSNIALLKPISPPRFDVLQVDSFEWLVQECFSSCSGRGFVFIDPPYDAMSMARCYITWTYFVVKHLREVWPGACVAVWYPISSQAQASNLHERMRQLIGGNILAVEATMERQRAEALPGSGIFVINPPDGLHEKLDDLLRAWADVPELSLRTSLLRLSQA